MNYREEIEKYKEELFAIRRHIHENPEIGNEEFATCAYIEEVLKGWGIPTVRILDTAVVAEILGGLPGKTVGLRADIDALPVTEKTGCDFASKIPGKMHACGHDVHTTAALGAARLLNAEKEQLKGTVKIFFQPNEEYSGGAKRMIDAGCMGDTAAVFGAHVDPNLPEGTIGVRYGKFYASSDVLDVTTYGKSAHGATPEKGINALYTMADIILKLVELPKTAAEDHCVLTIGTLESGTACNIVPNKAVASGILRALGPRDRASMKEAAKRVIDETAEKWGARAELVINKSYDGIVNPEDDTAFVEETLKGLLGDDHVVRIQDPLMISEDFGCFINASSGSFYHIGAGCSKPLHSDTFLPTEGALLTAAAAHAAVLKAYLERE